MEKPVLYSVNYSEHVNIICASRMYFLFDNLYSFSFPYIPTYITSIYSHLGESIIDLEIKIIPSYTRKEIEK